MKPLWTIILAGSLGLNAMAAYAYVQDRARSIELYNLSLAQSYQALTNLDQAAEADDVTAQHQALLRADDRLSGSQHNWSLLVEVYPGRVKNPLQDELRQADEALSDLLIMSVGTTVSPNSIEAVAERFRDLVEELPMPVKNQWDLSSALNKSR